MRRTLILLTPLLLAGCIKDSATYYVTEGGNDHAITVRAEQEYFWDEQVTLTLVAARMPECQRRFPMAAVPSAGELAVELFSNGENVFTVRSGAQVIQIDTQSCTQLAEPAANALGEALGVFRFAEEDMVFEKAAGASAPAAPPATPAPAPAPAPATATQ